jgi:gas vesicle protein
MIGFLGGLLLGGLAGAAAALLSSPRSGKENRELLYERFPELRERAPEIMPEIMNEAKARLEAGRAAFHEGAAETRERLSRELDERQGERPPTI